MARRVRELAASGKVVSVNAEKLRPYNSYGDPGFVERGYYQDTSYICRDCGAEAEWRATQQKWWYEVAKGAVYSTATRCPSCHRREMARRSEARRVHLEGIARKKAKQSEKR